MLKEELTRARSRIHELESQLGLCVLPKRESGSIDDGFWEVCEAMLAGICLHEIIFDDKERPIDYRIIRCNLAFGSILELDLDRAEGCTTSDVYGTKKAPYLDIFAEVASSGEPTNFEAYLAPIDKHLQISVSSLEQRRFITVVSDVTEQKKAELALIESERKTRAILDQTVQFIGLMEPDGMLIDANRTALEFTGLDPADVLGKPFWEAGWWINDKEQQNHLRENVMKAANGEAVFFDAFHPGADGEMHHFITSLKPVTDENGKVIYIIPEGRDVTEFERTKGELQRLALAVKYSDELVNMATMDGMMVFINEAGAGMLGIDPDEVEKFHIMQVIPEHLQELVKGELLPALMSGGTWEGELQYKNIKTGELTDVHAMTYTIPDQATGEPILLANVSRDISETKRAERQRRALEEQVQHMQKLESLGVLAGGIAHDFNNLLMGIIGNADLAAAKLPESSPVQRNIKGIGKAATRAADLCQQMLAYSGKGSFTVEVVDLRELVKEMTHILEVSIPKKASYTCQFTDGIPAVRADIAQLRQIVLNLIINASESLGEEGGAVSLTIGAEECDREYLADSFINEELSPGKYIFLEVADTGRGIDESALSKIFDPFFTTKFTGRGLGLSAVLGIVRGHKGTIKVESELGKGTRFKVLLPAVEDESTEHKGKQSSGQFWRGAGTVLLVDDDEIILSVVPEMLRECGFDVLTASNGREGLDVFVANKDAIDVVLLDHTMPVMDGAETFGEMQRIQEDVRVILCSGYSEQEVTSRFSRQRLAGFIQKPFRMDILREKLKQLLPE